LLSRSAFDVERKRERESKGAKTNREGELEVIKELRK